MKMIRTIWILTWEQWRESAKGIGLLSGALLVYAFLFYFVENLIKIAFSGNQAIAFGTAFLPVAGVVALMFLKESSYQVSFAFPRRMLSLPVHTSVLVGTQLAYKLVITMGLSAVAGYVCCVLMRPNFYVWPQVLLFAMLVTVVQAFVFLQCAFGAGTGLVLFVLSFAALLPVMEPAYMAVHANFAVRISRDGELLEPAFPEWWVWSAIVSVVLWSLNSYVGVRRARREVPGDSVGRFANVISRITYLEVGRGDFSSPEAAQRWLEWRRGAYLFPWLALGLGMFLLGVFSAALGGLESRFLVTFSLLAVGPIVMACLLGYLFTRSDPRYQWFVDPRPLTTQTLVRCRLRTGLKAITSAYFLALVYLFVANGTLYAGQNVLSSIVKDTIDITSAKGESVEIHVMMAALGVLILVAVWSMMWLGRALGGIAWCAGAVAILYHLVDDSAYNRSWGTFYNPSVLIFVWSMTAFVLLGVCWAMLRGYRRGLVSMRTIALCVIGWIALSASIFGLAIIISPAEQTLVMVWMIVPLAPLVTLPVTVDWQRHS